ncbi:MAG TPA: DNA repair protein RadC [Burkholderiales bacterium]|nr:DNA repair protein RadC [Burkholderiales bacterium]
MAIHDWPEGERPREKLLSKGPAALSEAELLAIVLRTGVHGKSAVDLGRELLQAYGSLSSLFSSNLERLLHVKGLGYAKAVQLQAVIELARRALEEELKPGVNLSSPKAVRDFLRLSLLSRDKEVFLGIFLDAQNRVVAVEELSSGTLTQTSVFPREVVKRALSRNAAALIFAHNHPSGLAEPSRADEMLTQALKQALALVDVKVLDHFIVGGSKTMSFAERGLL